jgi:hypothetical protein
MIGLDAFIEQGLAAARNALLGVRAEAGLHLEPKTVSKRLRARVRSRLKAIETIVRRLITLMAAALEVAPAGGAGATGRAAAPTAQPDGAEDVTQSFAALQGPVYHLRLTARPVRGLADWHQMLAGSGSASALATGPVPAAPLLAQIVALHRVLKDPEPAARRLARHLAGLKASRQPRPICPPSAGDFRLGAELGTVSTALPGLITRALADWPDTS